MLEMLLAPSNDSKDGSIIEIQAVTTHLIVSLRGMGKHAESLKQLKIILELNPNWELGHLIFSVLLIELGDIQSAIKIIETLPNNIITALPDSIPIIGSAYAAINNFEESRNYFFSVIHRSSPDDNETVQISLIGLIRGLVGAIGDFAKTENVVLNFIEQIRDVNPRIAEYIDLKAIRYSVCSYLSMPDIQNPAGLASQALVKANSGAHYGLVYTGKSMRIPDVSENKINFGAYISPKLTNFSLQKNILKFQNTIEDLIDKGDFKPQLENISLLKHTAAPEAGDPIVILSTGRCGTGALHNFFENTPKAESYHNFSNFPAPCDRNHLLYRILSGNFDEIIISKILKNYIECRTAEILFAYRNNKTPVIVSHWDTIYAPFISVAFPNSRFLYIKRDEYKVCASLFSKNQWRNRQLQYWLYDRDFPNGNFIYTRDKKRDIGQEIAWYLYITESYSLGFLNNISPTRQLRINSEDLFSQSEKTFSSLTTWAPELCLNYNLYRSAFMTPKNKKDDFTMYTTGQISAVCESMISELKLLNTNSLPS